MFFSKASLLAVLGVATAIQYASASNTHNRDALIPRQTSTTANDYSTEYWFDQLIDHANSTAGTFKQRYFFSDQYYKGQGAPIVIGTPGEQSADGFYSDLTGSSMMNMMMQNWGAAGVVLEHRYWGKSSPCTTLNAPNLQNLTIEDYKYFVETVVLPWAAGAYTTTPTSTPWVDIGSSYSGLLVGSVQQQGISEFRGWLENWYATHPGVTNTLATPGKLVIAARANPADTGDEAADDVDNKDDGLDDNTVDAAAVDDEDDQPDGTDPTADPNALDDEDDEDDEGDQPDGSDPTADAADDEDDEDDEGDQPDGTDPTADGTDPTADGTDPTADGTDPTADGTDPTADGTDPTANANLNAVDDEDDEVDQPDGTDPNANADGLDDEDDEDDEGDQPDGTDPTADANALDDEDDEDDEGDQPDGTDPTADPNALDDEDDEDDEGDQPDGTDPTANANALDDEDDEDDEGDQPDGSDPNANADDVDDEDDEDDEDDQPDGTDPTADGTDPTADGTDPTANPNDPNTASVDVVDDNPDDDTLNSIATDAGADDAATGQIQTNGNDNNSNNNTELQDKINQLAANKKLTIASFIVNGVLALLVIGCLVLLFLTKRKANKSKSTSSVLPRWVGGKDGVHEGDQLGEYGTGRRAGGRGQYKTLEEQTH